MLGMGGGLAHGIAGGGIGGMVLGAAHKQLRERGNATLAVLLDKLGTLGGLSEVSKAAKAHLDDVVSMALAKNTTQRPTPKVNYSSKRFDEEAERIKNLATSPNAVSNHLSKQTAAIANHAPEVAAGVNSKAAGAVKYLSSKLPASYRDPSSSPTLTPNAQKPAASNADMTKFLRTVDAVEKGPTEIFKDVMRGHGTLEEVDALRNVYPASYEEIRRRVLEKCTSLDKPLPYQKAVRLGILFDAPTHESLQADLIQQEQAMYAAKKQTPNPGSGPAPGKKRGSTQKPLQSPQMMAGMFEAASQSEKG
jgi:hypothetical protein